LQALRWRVTKTVGVDVRRSVLKEFETNDLLLLAEKQSLLEFLLQKKNNKVREFTLKLVNAICSDFQGRRYLLKSPKVIPILIMNLKSEVTDSIIRQNSLGALQKLSLKKETQLTMIEFDLMLWIIQIMKNEKDIMSEYSLEYATALFMNLSLRTKGKKKCENSNLTLETLALYLQHHNIQVRTFVNGSLYSLFTRRRLRQQAIDLGIDVMLKRIISKEDSRIRK